MIMIKSILKTTAFIWLFCLLFFSCTPAEKEREPVACNGILDLTMHDFDRDGVVSLNGPWKFCWMHDSSVYSKKYYDVSDWDSIVVPTTWKGAVNQSYGFGWMRLTVIVNCDKDLRAYLENTVGASVLYCNGEVLITSGIPGNTQQSSYAERNARSVLLPKTDTLVFAWKNNNFDEIFGGPRHPVLISEDASMLKSVAGRDFLVFTIFGIILIMVFYHILLWSRRPNDTAILYFGIFCFVILIRLYISDIIISPFFHFPNWYYLLRSVEIVTFPFAVILFLIFLAKLFPNESPTRLIWYIVIIASLLVINALITLFTSWQIFDGTHYVAEAATFLAFVYCFSVLIRAIKNKRAYSKLLFLGLLILVITVCIDIYYYTSPQGHRFLVYSGLLFFIVIQSVILSFKFADAHNTAEHLTEHLKEEVELKTTDLRHKSKELEQMNLELKKADEYKTRFFQNITHEFKTPLTLITGPVHSIMSGQYGKINEAIRQQLEMVKQNGYKTLTLVNQLMELARSDNKQLELSLSRQNIGEVMKNIIANFESIAQRNQITIGFKPENRSPVISLIDIEKFERIFYNLLSNALKHTRPGGSVGVMLQCDTVLLRYYLTVADTGCGIADEHIPFIFDRFYRVIHKEPDGAKGTGIGLALAKEYTLLHGGSIIVNSKPGEGTSFVLGFPIAKYPNEVIEMPCTKNVKIEFIDSSDTILNIAESEIGQYLKSAEKEIASECIHPDKPDSQPVDNHKTIVVVEDNKDMRAYIYEILKSAYHVREAVNGEEGFEMIANNLPDLVISDVMMPGMDGMELCRKLKTDIRTEHIPVVLLTARSTSEDSREGFSSGADDYIPKPFNRELLLIRINNLIESRIKIREHFKTRFLMEHENLVVESNMERFINKAVQTVNHHLSDSDFSVDHFASEMGISQAQLYRKLTSVIGQTPAEFIRVVRLNRAAKMLEESIEKDLNISEISFSLGFSNHSYFSQLFKKHFGLSPTEYANKFG